MTLDGARPPQIARGSAVADADGTRRATLLFPANLTATLVLSDNTSVPLNTLHIRATEYTVGANGPKAMPGPLPANSAYTYAAEFSADEAIAIGAKTVRFSEPVINYLENFLGFPVGAERADRLLRPRAGCLGSVEQRARRRDRECDRRAGQPR